MEIGEYFLYDTRKLQCFIIKKMKTKLKLTLDNSKRSRNREFELSRIYQLLLMELLN